MHQMRAYLITGAAILAAAAAVLYVVFADAPDTVSGDKIVDMRSKSTVPIVLTDVGFEPRYVRVSVGTEIVFTTSRSNQFWPASNEHPTHSLYSEFDSKRPLAPNESWSFVIERVGEWSYHDHVRSYYTGRIYVE